jgi:CTP:molybdopterin cytidylyltransferase MocA
MGAVKQLLDVGGKPQVARAVDAAVGAGARPVAVVLGASADLVRSAVAERGILEVVNGDWARGLATSICAGLAALLAAEASLEAVLLAPCDQPALSSEVILQLSALHRATGLIAAARYHGRNGAPAVFGRGHFEALLALTGDEGARKLLNADSTRVAAIDLPELGADLDTPEDYASWLDRRP